MAVRGLLAYAARSGYIAASPCDVLTRRERPKPGRPKDRFLTPSEIQQLLEHSGGAADLIVPMLLFSGLRVAELLGLTPARHRLQTTCHPRSISDESQGQEDPAENRRWAPRGDHDGRAGAPASQEARSREVFRRSRLDRRQRSRQHARVYKAPQAFTKSATDAGIDGATPHACRHTFASILIDQGADVEFLSDQLGHASTKTTWDIYVHLFRAREHAEAARSNLDAAFGPMLRAAGDDASDE
jgi:integrase/recombinase XerD